MKVLPLVLHLPEGLRPSAVIIAGCDLFNLLSFLLLLHYIWIDTPAPVLPLAQVLHKKISPGRFTQRLITDFIRSYCLFEWTTCPVKEKRKTQKRKRLHLKVSYLCALGSSWLTSPVYWGLCDLNAALQLLFCHGTQHTANFSKKGEQILMNLRWFTVKHKCLENNFPKITRASQSEVWKHVILFFTFCFARVATYTS